MNVAAYHPWVYLKGGAERTLLELMRRSRHHWTLLTNHYDAESTFPEFADLDVIELRRVSVRRTVVYAGHAVLTVLTQKLPLEGVDALMISSEGVGNLAALRSGNVPVFCLCLTPLRVAHDPYARERYFQRQPSRLTRLAVAAYAQLDRYAWRRYQRVFCISKEVWRRVIDSELTPAEQTEIVHPGVDLKRFDPQGPQEPFFLLPGRIMWTKNIELGIDAFNLVRQRLPEAAQFRLVVAGMVDRKSRPYLDALRARAGGDRAVQFVECPSDYELWDLYRRCYAVLFTAFNEDWGLVPLEAMASGKPVVAVGRGGPLESIVHGETGFLVSPEATAFADVMTRLLADPDQAVAMGQAGRRHVARFPWDGFVQRIDDYIDGLAGPKANPDLDVGFPVATSGGR